MRQPKNTRLVSALFILVVILAVVLAVTRRPGSKPPPAAVSGFYWTGAMKSKGDPNLYGTEAGEKVAPPSGAMPAPAKTSAPTASAGAVAP